MFYTKRGVHWGHEVLNHTSFTPLIVWKTSTAERKFSGSPSPDIKENNENILFTYSIRNELCRSQRWR
eukprot:4890692-Prymnesium_polylepis.1